MEIPKYNPKHTLSGTLSAEKHLRSRGALAPAQGRRLGRCRRRLAPERRASWIARGKCTTEYPMMAHGRQGRARGAMQGEEPPTSEPAKSTAVMEVPLVSGEDVVPFSRLF